MNRPCPIIRKNESKTDRIVRVIAGAAMGLTAANYLSGTIKTVAEAVAVVLVVTGVSGFCLLYQLLGISTKQNKSH